MLTRKAPIALIALAATLSSGFAHAASRPEASNEEKSNKFVERLIAELLSDMGTPRFEFNFTIDSESKGPFKLDHAYAQAVLPLNDAVKVPLSIAKRQAGRDFTPTITFGEKDLMIQFDTVQKEPGTVSELEKKDQSADPDSIEPSADLKKRIANADFVSRLSFSEGGTEIAMPLDVKFNQIGMVKFKLNSMIVYTTVKDDGDLDIFGTCRVYQQMVQTKDGKNIPLGGFRRFPNCSVTASKEKREKDGQPTKWKYSISLGTVTK